MIRTKFLGTIEIEFVVDNVCLNCVSSMMMSSSLSPSAEVYRQALACESGWNVTTKNPWSSTNAAADSGVWESIT